MGQSNWKSVKISTIQFERIKRFCDKSGQSVAFHLNKSLENYLADEMPVWEEKIKAVREGLRKR